MQRLSRRTILFLHASADLYGSDRTLLQLVRGLDRDRFRAVVALPVSGPLVEVLESEGAIVEIGPLGIGARATLSAKGFARLCLDVPRAVRFVRGLVRRHDPAMIHTNTIVVLGGALGAWTTRRPHLWHVHEILPPRGFVPRAMASALRLLCHRAVSNSRATLRSFDRICPALAEKHEVILNGVDLDDARRRGREEVRRAAGFEEDCPLVTLVGRINSWKGQELFVDAAARLRDKHPGARYLIVGDAPPGQDHFVRELERRISTAGVGDVVRCIGFTSDVRSIFHAADVVAVPSTRPEPFGLVAIEAMAESAPVVAAAHGGLAEVVVPHETGLLFAPGDVGGLAACLDELLSDPDLRRSLGANGKLRQLSEFTVERYCRQFEDLYREMTPGHGERAAA